MIYAHHSQFERLGPNCTKAAEPGSRFLCATCWQIFPMHDHGPGATGYGIDCDTYALRCYACCHLRDVESLRDRSRPFGAYLSSDGASITNWPGSPLMHVTQRSTSRTGWHGSTLTHVRARDVHGADWYGKGGGRGMCITLRPCK